MIAICKHTLASKSLYHEFRRGDIQNNAEDVYKEGLARV